MLRSIRVALVASLMSVCLGGCLFNQAGPKNKLRESVLAMNKATRWAQLAQATRMVDPTYRARFAETHRHWGSRIQVADSEVVEMEMTPDAENAIAIVAYNWYLSDAMTLQTTVVRQRWADINGNYGLISEAIVQGDPRLFDLADQGKPKEIEFSHSVQVIEQPE
jgi:hypothetical protein